MTASLRLLVAPLLALTVVACGAGPTEVTSDGGSVRAASAAAPVQDAPATTAPAAKTTPLSEISTVGFSDRAIAGAVKVNGTVYEDSVYVPRCQEESNLLYDINRAYTKLQGVAGLEDGTFDPEEPGLSPSQGGPVTVTILGDGVVKSTVTVKMGAPVPFDIDLTNVLRLRIDVKGGFSCIPSAGMSTVVAFGDAKLTPKP